MNKGIGITSIIIILALTVGFFIGRTTSNRYYFMKQRYSNAFVVIRCDQITGNIDYVVKSKNGIKTIEMK
ncbi:MAG: hypothetical protein P794_01495 [Epsilonproteobacteria bacterium (ex Lamellibrachia satsuma)]|nr:MAG: hypothetical protein P794_01495 [Epsilonproteobacteria bacterium (ex Lamellibrachia satsuma)]